jgi:hypothetical protein
MNCCLCRLSGLENQAPGGRRIVLTCGPRYLPRASCSPGSPSPSAWDLRRRCPEAKIEAGRIVLTPGNKRRHRVKIVTDPATGLPAFSAGPDAPALTSKEVAKILANFS